MDAQEPTLKACPKCLVGFLDLHCSRLSCFIYKCRSCGFGVDTKTGRTAMLVGPKVKEGANS